MDPKTALMPPKKLYRYKDPVSDLVMDQRKLLEAYDRSETVATKRRNLQDLRIEEIVDITHSVVIGLGSQKEVA